MKHTKLGIGAVIGDYVECSTAEYQRMCRGDRFYVVDLKYASDGTTVLLGLSKKNSGYPINFYNEYNFNIVKKGVPPMADYQTDQSSNQMYNTTDYFITLPASGFCGIQLVYRGSEQAVEDMLQKLLQKFPSNRYTILAPMYIAEAPPISVRKTLIDKSPVATPKSEDTVMIITDHKN